MSLRIDQSTGTRDAEARCDAVLRSALWAAAGDALGWITELSRGEQGVQYRSGVTQVTQPIVWHRLIGGKGGPRVRFAAGTYSDDTQLRLAVSRAIRGDGTFDVEAFAKIELTVWPTYALGGGIGTKAAASNLTRRGVNWFSNFFKTSTHSYVESGGNGAAMRIQPHVWAARDNAKSPMLLNVLRDALVTHGHPHGFCGAVFHALALESTIRNGSLPGISLWGSFVARFSELSDLVSDDPQLAAFWRSAWEAASGRTLKEALRHVREEGERDIAQIEQLLDGPDSASYHRILDVLGCLSPKFRGSGLKTVLASTALAELFRSRPVEEALVCAANELESDTDTIATMAGALLGALAPSEPLWPIQDRQYISSEAVRLAEIASGKMQQSFRYPDLALWNPPAKQNASVGLHDHDIAIAGLGVLRPAGGDYNVGDSAWEWYELSFGQTILAKRKSQMGPVAFDQLPGSMQSRVTEERPMKPKAISPHPTLPFSASREAPRERKLENTVDRLSDDAISSGFDDATLGRLLNQCIDTTNSVDSAIAFAAIVAKAKLARARRRR